MITVLFCILASSLPAGEEFSLPIERKHGLDEVAFDAGFLYGIHWAGYFYLFKIKHDNGGKLADYHENFMFKRLQWWDGDSFWWNFVGHPYTGSQTYLYYRARGYGKKESFWGSFTASFLFESTIEVMQEGFSFNDAVVTPVLGYVVGNILESVSIKWIKQKSPLKRLAARILNPSLNFSYYEGVKVVPAVTMNGAYCFLYCGIK